MTSLICTPCKAGEEEWSEIQPCYKVASPPNHPLHSLSASVRPRGRTPTPFTRAAAHPPRLPELPYNFPYCHAVPPTSPEDLVWFPCCPPAPFHSPTDSAFCLVPVLPLGRTPRLSLFRSPTLAPPHPLLRTLFGFWAAAPSPSSPPLTLHLFWPCLSPPLVPLQRTYYLAAVFRRHLPSLPVKHQFVSVLSLPSPLPRTLVGCRVVQPPMSGFA